MATPKRKPKSEPEALKQEPLSEQIIRWIEALCLVPEGRDVYKPLVLRVGMYGLARHPFS
jgi:hypothetical protein